MLAYGSVNHRPYHDVDILISRAQLKELHIILCSCGYMQREHSREDNVLLLSASHQTLRITVCIIIWLLTLIMTFSGENTKVSELI